MTECPLHRQSQAFPTHLFIKSSKKCWTFGEAYQEVLKIEMSLVEWVKTIFESWEKNHRNVKVVILAQESPFYCFLLIALYRLGWIAIPLNYRKPPQRLLEEIEEVEADIVLGDRSSVSALKKKNQFLKVVDFSQMMNAIKKIKGYNFSSQL